MSNKTIQIPENWQRLWLPIEEWDETPRLGDDFLTQDGEAFATEWFSAKKLKGISPLSAFSQVPFLLLLGRPGAGKSNEIEKAAQEHALGRCILIRGKEIGSSDPGPLIQQQIEAEYHNLPERENLRILIDGLDEVLLSSNHFVPRLLRWLRPQKNAEGQLKYKLAISTRWADWPESQVNELAALWPQGSFKKLVLAPLKRPDVVETLTSRYGEQDANQFWYQMVTRRLHSVACWPQGLLSLMAGFESTGHKLLAQSYGEAIGNQVQGLCALTDNRDDLGRWEASIKGLEWRRRLAGRLAATMIFSGRQSLSLDTTPQADEANSIRIEDIAHTQELWLGEPKPIQLADLNELVEHTGLLKRQGSSRRWVFQSQVYQEWLAADWIASQNLDAKRLQTLLGHIHEENWRVYTPLKPVAAWLAGMSLDFLSLLRENDPLVLLRMDAGTLPEKERQKVAEAILTATNKIGTTDYNEVENSHLGSLMHPGLASQLRVWLDDPTSHTATKELAIEIIHRAEMKDMVPYLWTLYPQTEGRLRIEIANTLARLAKDEQSVPQWQSVLSGEISLDDNGTLLAAALEFLVVERKEVPVREIIQWVLPKYEFGVIGDYTIVAPKLPSVMTVDDVPAVLTSLKKVALHDEYETFEPAGNFNKQALKLALINFDRQEIASAFTDYWHHCLSRYYHPHEVLDLAAIAEEGHFDVQQRRKQVIHQLIHHPHFKTNKKRKYLVPSLYLFVREDMEWCLDEVIQAVPEEEWQYALVVADYVWHADLTGPLGEKLVQALGKSAFLRGLLPTPEEGRTILETIAEIVRKQEVYQEAQVAIQVHKLEKSKRDFQNDLTFYTESYKQVHDQGDIVWPNTLSVLGSRKHGRGSFIVAIGLEEEVRDDEEWIREAARRYLIEVPKLRSVEDENGIQALLALAVCPQYLSLPGPVQDSVVAHWLPSLLRCMTDSSLEKKSVGLSRSNLAALFPAPFAKAFGQVMRTRYQGQGTLAELRGFIEFWSPQMTAEIIQILTEEPIQPSGFPTALRYLFEISPADAVTVAQHWLPQIDQLEDNAKATVVGACLLLLSGRLAQDIQPWLDKEDLIAAALTVATRSFDYSGRRMDVSTWPNEALQDLANASWKAFPKFKKNRLTTNPSRFLHEVTAEDTIIDFRSHITAEARNRGLRVTIPPGPSDETQEDAAARESFTNWNNHLIQSKQAGEGWQPLVPEVLFKLVKIPNARLARSNDELMEAVIESLRRWETKVNNGWWKRLWDLDSKKSRSENDISDEMREWLKPDLEQLLVEREVKLLADTRSDIIIQATSSNPSAPTLTVVIEVKKVRPDNEQERLNAMDSQLIDRYLTKRLDEGWTHGLFLVAWTPVPGTKEDSEKAMANEAEFLFNQSDRLSQPPFTLKSLVLDARYRGKTNPPKKPSAKKKITTKNPKGRQ